MSKVINFLMANHFKSYLKKYKSGLLYSFIFGLFMGSIPFIFQTIENFKVKQLIQEQRKIRIQKKEKICKGDNSEYKKFLSLGFPQTAIEKFNKCMEKDEKI